MSTAVATARLERLRNDLSFYNTMSRALERFVPIDPNQVLLYCCGPTVYNFQHIGNLRTYVFEDVLVRTLRAAGHRVKHAMNITDVGHLVSDADEGEDKMAVAARREGKKSHEIAAYYTEVFFADSRKLNIQRPDVVCKATDHIAEMISLIQRLEQQGFAYLSGGNVYFDISRFAEYGKLARLDPAKQFAGARIEADNRKRNPLDFALWFTKSKFENQEMQWESPWGTGYPGWHIECSAMAIKHLGERIDIHCGGIDHVGVHHTNEIAQSEAAIGHAWVNTWLHGAFLVDTTGKMSKSKGKFLTVATLEEEGFDPLAYRMLCLGAHYRSELAFNWDTLKSADNALGRLRRWALEVRGSAPTTTLGANADAHLATFEAALADDLNAPRGLGALWNVVNDRALDRAEAHTLLQRMESILGLGLLEWTPGAVEEVPASIQALAKQRDEARQAKNWAEADRLRGEIETAGYTVKDGPAGATVTKGGK